MATLVLPEVDPGSNPSEVSLERSAVRVSVPGWSDFFVLSVALAEPDSRGSWSGVRIYFLEPETGIWENFPFRRKLSSRFGHAAFATWPPETFDRAYSQDGSLVLEFRDPCFAYDSPILPFGLDRESLWIAVLDRQSRSWRLRRKRFLDYGGADRGEPRLPRIPENELADFERSLNDA